METKHDLIHGIVTQLFRITKKQARIEEIPCQLENDILVTPTEGHTLLEIGFSKSINITEIAVRFGVTKSAASQIVAKLSQKGMVEKKMSTHSAKELQLELTEQGQKAFEVIKKYRRVHFDNISERLKGFSLAQIATAAAFLDVIEDVTDEKIKKR